jgi:hypothetical protein
MNIRDHISIQAWQDHYETFQAPTPVPMNHPPYLKKPKIVEQPAEMFKDRQTKKKGKKKKAKRKPNDLAYVMRRTLNQGRPTMVRHSHGGDPNLWNPSQIADL